MAKDAKHQRELVNDNTSGNASQRRLLEQALLEEVPTVAQGARRPAPTHLDHKRQAMIEVLGEVARWPSAIATRAIKK